MQTKPSELPVAAVIYAKSVSYKSRPTFSSHRRPALGESLSNFGEVPGDTSTDR